eukprot:8739840-Pyramimonas_sp.AAC.1
MREALVSGVAFGNVAHGNRFRTLAAAHPPSTCDASNARPRSSAKGQARRRLGLTHVRRLARRW